jgi:uncharacterized protein with ParB-like and HNH nuclease domain
MPLLNINEIMEDNFLSNDRIVNIPSFQRGYSWKKRNLEEFLRDVDRIRDEQYFTGSLLIKQNVDNDYFDLIDGQQRMTTLFIFLSAIKEHKSTPDLIKQQCTNIIQLPNGLCRLHSQDADTNSYISYILLGGEKPIENSVYYKNMEVAKFFFCKELNKPNYYDFNLEYFFIKLTQNLVFNVIEIPENLSDFKVFESINQRGVKLSQLELLKNRILYMVQVLANTQLERQTYANSTNTTWKTIYTYLGKEENFSSEDDTFLRSHTFVYFGFMDDTKEEWSDFLFNNYFTDDNGQPRGIRNIRELHSYIHSLRSSIKFWFSINHPNHPESVIENTELKRWLTKMTYLEKHHFSVLILALFMRGLSEDEILKYVKIFERFCFVVYYIFCWPVHYSKNFVYGAVNSIYKDNDQNSKLTEFMTELTLRFNKDYVIGMNTTSLADKLSKIKNKPKNRFWLAFDKIEYLLLEYEEFLCKEAQGEMFISEFPNKDNIDLIYNHDNTYHITLQSFGAVQNTEENESLMSSLGNLLLVQSVNGERKSYSKEVLQRDYTKWNKDTIINRGLEILHFLEKRWNITLGDDDFKIGKLLT